MYTPVDLSPYYAVLGASFMSNLSDLRHLRNKRLLEVNHPLSSDDWQLIDEKTQVIQRAYKLLKQNRLAQKRLQRQPSSRSLSV